jgi:hypothetical protein
MEARLSLARNMGEKNLTGSSLQDTQIKFCNCGNLEVEDGKTAACNGCMKNTARDGGMLLSAQVFQGEPVTKIKSKGRVTEVLVLPVRLLLLQVLSSLSRRIFARICIFGGFDTPMKVKTMRSSSE